MEANPRLLVPDEPSEPELRLLSAGNTIVYPAADCKRSTDTGKAVSIRSSFTLPVMVRPELFITKCGELEVKRDISKMNLHRDSSHTGDVRRAGPRALPYKNKNRHSRTHIFVDPPGVEPGPRPCHGRVLPLYYGPVIGLIILRK